MTVNHIFKEALERERLGIAQTGDPVERAQRATEALDLVDAFYTEAGRLRERAVVKLKGRMSSGRVAREVGMDESEVVRIWRHEAYLDENQHGLPKSPKDR